MKFKELREQKKISQQKVANDLNFNAMTYCNWENEKREPNINALCKIADYYNVSLDYIVGRNFNNEFGYLTENEKNIVYAYRQMSPEQQTKTTTIILRMLAEN